MGFDHIRLPIDEEQMWDNQGKRNEDAFQLMTNCIDWCAENNLRVIVDLHILRSHHFNAEVKPLWTEKKEQEKFYDFWRDLSKALKKYPVNLVAYELMNEAVADDPELWNNLVSKAVSAIREVEPSRTIVIGSNMWQSVGTFDVLKIPANDPNILLSFHFYEPFLLTHWHASWTNQKNYTGPVHYPGTILTQSEFDALPKEMQKPAKKWVNKQFDKAWILEQWQKPIKKAKELGLPLYCGEFGIITGPPQADMEQWYQDMIDLFEENGIGYANWNYKSGSFGLIDEVGKKREEFIKIISGK
jgi:endoglucanase